MLVFFYYYYYKQGFCINVKAKEIETKATNFFSSFAVV